MHFWILGLLLSSLGATQLYAGVMEQCYRMHNRLVGTPPNAADLTACQTLVEQGQSYEAALAMTEQDRFFSGTLRYTFSPWTNEDDNLVVDLNDMSATLIGIVRDDLDFREALSGDIIYTCQEGQGVPAFQLNSNEHYQACGDAGNLKTALVRGTQTALNPALANQTGVPAGVYTTRAFAMAHYEAGTNRAATAHTLKNFLCEEIDYFNDTTIADFRIRQDVDRAPGGSPKTFINECKGCHAGMDPLTGAFAYLNWGDEETVMTFTPGEVVRKFFNNASTFPSGFRTEDDGWANLWTKGQNARIGWNVTSDEPSGNGPKSFGEMMANTDQFTSCMAKTALEKVCLQDVDLKDDKTKTLAGFFKENNYNMRQLFAKSATLCMGE